MILNIQLNDLTLQFAIEDNPVAQLWLDRMALREQWPLDDPKRFYGFDTQEQEELIALKRINYCITLIKIKNPGIAVGHLETVHDQDKLNYWHHIFEVQHGLLGTEDRTNELTAILADLNLAIHRCESVARGNRPRFVCTWYGMPKTQTLSTELMKEYGTLNPGFGAVCLNYCQIGKTLEYLAQDNDKYIGDEAFQPFDHYSADFNVRLYDETEEYSSEKLTLMEQFYCDHTEFFHTRGYMSFQDPRLLPLRFPVANLIETQPREQLIEQIRQRQQITKIWIE